ncbi:Alpha-L-fucosidase 2 [Linum perenne]
MAGKARFLQLTPFNFTASAAADTGTDISLSMASPSPSRHHRHFSFLPFRLLSSLFLISSISFLLFLHASSSLFVHATQNHYWNPTAADSSVDVDPLKLIFTSPAKFWTDAIPIGNGRLGAILWGGVLNETLQLNDDTLWTGVPGIYTDSNAPAALAVVRKLVNSGQYSQASTEALKLSGTPSQIYQLLGDIVLEFDASHRNYDPKTYHRELDLDTATATVKYTVGEVEYTREHFASNPNQAIVSRISGSKPGSLSFTVHMDSKMNHTSSHVEGKHQILLTGSCRGNPKGIQFTAMLDLKIGGGSGAVINVLEGGKLKVVGADWAVLVLVASSSFDGPFTSPVDSKKNPTSDCQKGLNSLAGVSYSDLRARHLGDYQSLFHRVSLQFSKGSSSDSRSSLSTAERVKSFKTDEDPSLVALMFQYGRYLLISCSRPGTQVANLQGIWNKDINPPWDGAQHLNINLQMNYWPALSCNLKECQEPLFDYMSSLSVNGKKTAKVNYGANGWVAHQVSDIWAKTSPDQGDAIWAMYPLGGSWLCTHLWEHYSYTMDKNFLEKKGYPLLEGCAEFLLDWLIEGPGGFLETNPSTSPEHKFIGPDGKQASVSNSTTMDMSIIRQVFSDIVSAAEVLGRKSDELIQKVGHATTRLPPTKIAKEGTVMEWAFDFKDPEPQHRHVSHLFGLYPGHTITPQDTPALCNASENTLIKRGVEGPGWSTVWKAALWARLQKSDKAYQMVKHLFNLVDPAHEGDYEGGVFSNLFTAHPPFQIDANLGFSAAISEMLVQGTGTDLFLLPAHPRDKWPNGCAKGIKARGGVTVNLCWKNGELEEAGLWSTEGNSIQQLHYREKMVKASIVSCNVYTFNRELTLTRTESLSQVDSSC